MFLKVTNVTTGDEMYVNIDTVKGLIPTEVGQTLILFVDGDRLLVEESIDDLLEDEE